MPSSDGDRRSPGEAERALGTDCRFANAELGVRCEIEAELPGNIPG